MNGLERRLADGRPACPEPEPRLEETLLVVLMARRHARRPPRRASATALSRGARGATAWLVSEGREHDPASAEGV